MEAKGCALRSHAKPIPLLRLAVALVALALASLLALAASAEPAWAKDGSFGGGDGSSEDNAILIEDEADMVAFASLNDPDISSGYGNELDASKSKYGKFFKLTANLDMTADAYKSTFHPVGLLEFDSWGSTIVGYVAFNGTFDGDGHTVKVALESKNATFLGLFPLVKGTSASPAVVKNLIVDGSVAAKSSSASGVGGICGKASFTTFSQCANSAAVSGRQYVGGILGKQESAKKPVTIEQSRNSGAITATRASGDSYAGGIAGQLPSGTADKASAIVSCYNVGAVSVGGGNYAGGIVGQLQGGTLASDGESRMENCYSSGAVTGNYVGGLMGIPSMTNSSANVYKTYLKNSFSTVSPIVSEKMKQFGNDASTAGRYTYQDASGAAADIATGVVADLSTDEFLATINNGGSAFVKGETAPVLAWEKGGSQPVPEPEPEGDLIIHDKAEFLAFVNAVNGGETYEGKVVALAADIDMAGEQTYPIGYKSSNYIEKNWFMGTFDGNGHAITGVNVVAHPNSRVAGGNVGLFGYVKGASNTTPTVIKNFTVSGKVQGAGEYVGGVVGNANSASVENVGSSVIVMSTKAGATTVGCQVGGLVGGVSGTLVVDGCYARGAVVASSGTAVGGLIGGVGRIDEQSGYDGNICKATVSNSYSTAAVYASDYVGGLIGAVTQNKDKAFSNVVMTNCYAASSVTSTGSATGSLLGLTSSGAAGTNLFVDSDAASGLNPVGEIASYQVIGYPNPGPKVDGEDLVSASVESMSAASMGTADFAAKLGAAFKAEFPAANGSHPALAWEKTDSAATTDISSYALSAQGGNLESDGSFLVPALEVKQAGTGAILDSACYTVRYFSDEACTVAIPASALNKPGTYYAKAYGNAGLGYVGATQAVSFELSALGAWTLADEGENQVTATLYHDGVFVVSGNGTAATHFTDPFDSDVVDVPWKDVRSQIKTVRFASTVTLPNIDYWFAKCSNLSKVENFPAGLASIEGLFMGTYLDEVPAIPETVANMQKAFSNAGLTVAPNVPAGVTSLYRTFEGSGFETAPVIPEGVTDLEMTFNFCSDLKTAPAIPSTVTNMRLTFSRCTALATAPETLPSGLTNLDSAFSSCSSLESVSFEIPASVTKLDYTFRGCKKLANAPKLSGGLQSMVGAFSGCAALAEAPAIPSTVKNINDAFKGCESIVAAPLIPEGVTSMTEAFYNCPKLTVLPKGFAIPENAETSWCDFGFDDAPEAPIKVTCSASDFAALNAHFGTDWELDCSRVLVSLTPITADNVKVSARETYTGSAIEPAVTVTVGDKVLVANTDYVVSCEENVEPGTAKVTVTGQGDYEGMVELSFEIVSADTSELEGALKVAEASRAATVASVDGSDVYVGSYWAPQDAIDAIDAAIAAAREALAKTPSTEAEIADAVTALNEAVEAFEAARQEGTMPVPEPLRFTDVDYSSWYAPGVDFVAGRGLMTGYEGTTVFGVGNALTRGELATILWRNACPDEAAAYDPAAAKDATGIAGSADGMFYTAAANWAVKKGVITGFERPDGIFDFAADEPVTFEQLVTILGRLGAAPGEVEAAGSDLSAFVDGADASEWSAPYIKWAADKGLIEGYDEPAGKRLAPGEDVARERAATVLMRAFDKGILK